MDILNWLRRQMFSGMGGVIGSGARIEIYEAIELLLSNQVQLSVALNALYDIESKDGKKKGEVAAIVLQDCINAMESGKPLSIALERWVPDQEVQLIRAGERSGDLTGAFKDAIKIIQAKSQIMSAVLGGLIYPIVLGGFSCILLYQIANNMVPQFARIIPPEHWTGATAVLREIADFVNTKGVYSLIGLFFVLVWVMWSLPNMHRTRVRKILDRIPPWSIYRTLHGSTFLLNVAVMLRAGIRVQEILTMISHTGSPWLKSRVGAALNGITQGENLGEALHMSGYNFPDERSVQFLRLLSNQSGFDDRLGAFADRWLVKSISNVKAASQILLYIGISATAGLLMLVIAGVFSMQQLAQQVMG